MRLMKDYARNKGEKSATYYVAHNCDLFYVYSLQYQSEIASRNFMLRKFYVDRNSQILHSPRKLSISKQETMIISYYTDCWLFI